MSEDIFCKSCGKILTVDVKNCKSCGEKNSKYIDDKDDKDYYDYYDKQEKEVDTLDTLETSETSDNETIDAYDAYNDYDDYEEKPVEKKKFQFGEENNNKKRTKNKIDFDMIVKNRKIILGMVICLIIITPIFSVFFHFKYGNGNSDILADKYLEAYLSYDGDDLLDLVHEDILDEYVFYNRIRDDDFEDGISNSAKYHVDRVAEKIDVSTRKITNYCDILRVENIELGDREIDTIIEKYEDYFSTKKIKDVKTYEYDIKFIAKDFDLYGTTKVNFFRVGTTWYWDFINNDYNLSFSN